MSTLSVRIATDAQRRALVRLAYSYGVRFATSSGNEDAEWLLSINWTAYPWYILRRSSGGSYYLTFSPHGEGEMIDPTREPERFGEALERVTQLLREIPA